MRSSLVMRTPEPCRHRGLGTLITCLAVLAGLGCAVLRQDSAALAASRAQGGAGHVHRATPAAGKTATVHMYLIALGDNGKSGKRIGCGDSLVPVTRQIPPTNAPLTAAVRLLLQNHSRLYGRSGLYNALYQARLSLKKAIVLNGRATIHLVGTLKLRGECDDPRVAAQLKQTALQFRTVHNVSILINDVPLWKRLGGRGR